jgi:hypothetical protein
MVGGSLRSAGRQGEEGSVFFFLKKKEAKKTSFAGAWVEISEYGMRRDGLLRFARNDK